jgi:hypothetical protein
MNKYEIYESMMKGKLDEEAEKKLFMELATDDDARLEFNSYRAVANSVEKNAVAFTPSAALKSSVFAKAGMQVPAGAGTGTVTGGFFSGKLFTGILSSVASALIVYLMLNSFGDKEIIQIPESPVTKNEIPVTESTDAGETTPEIREVVKYVYLPISSESKQNGSIITAEPTENYDLSNYKVYESGNYFQQVNELNSGPINNPPVHFGNPVSVSIPQIKGRDKFFIGLEDSQNWNLPEESVTTGAPGNFKNNGLFIGYNFNENIAIELLVRRESFFTEYRHTEQDGSIYQYRQHPEFTSYSLAGNYKINNLAGDFGLYGRAEIGFNEAGYVLSPGAGIMFSLNENVELVLGAHYRWFLFSHQGNLYNSRKAGVRYGINYSF